MSVITTLVLALLLTFTADISYSMPVLIEGDIVRSAKMDKIHRMGHLSSNGGRSKRNVASLPHAHRWKHGLVPYTLSVKLGVYARLAIKEAMQEVERRLCIQFSPRLNEIDYVEFINDEGCYSDIGRKGGRQVVSIGEGCIDHATIVHELLHTLGMYHEMTRLDRSQHVDVLWWNIIDDAMKNYETYAHGKLDTLSYPYDYRSVTHYSNAAFSKNGKITIRATKSPNLPLGNRKGMSSLDTKKLFYYYRCNKKYHRPKKATCADKLKWCASYISHCNIPWFANGYCQKTCATCF